MTCVFCRIVERTEPASIVYEDEQTLAFMDIRPVRTGQLLVIPKQHTDHFADLPDDLASALFLIGQQLSRALRSVLAPLRVGMVVHGFGVAHAHLIVLPLEHAWDITSAQAAGVENGRVHFRWEHLPLAERGALDALAGRLRREIGA